MNKTLTFCIVFCMLLLRAGSSRAALIFFDDFDSYTITTPDSGLNWQGEGNWTVTEQSVDLIGSGTSWDWFSGSHGKYLDMDGTLTSPNAGAIESINIALKPGDYVLSFDIAGNQRNGVDDAVLIEVSGLLTGSVTSIPSTLPFTNISMPFTVATATSATISFEGVGGDNVGALLDNVALNSVDGRIPAPGALLLGSIGTGFVSWLRRRKTL